MKKNLLKTIILIVIDQVVKIIIKNFFMYTKLYLKGVVGFFPYLNTSQLSMFNNEMHMNLNYWKLIIINIIAIGILVGLYIILKRGSKEKSIKYLNKMFVFLFSGIVCSLIDKIFWGGSLDYFLIGSQVMDIKDLYLLLGFCFYVVWVLIVKREEGLEKIKQ